MASLFSGVDSPAVSPAALWCSFGEWPSNVSSSVGGWSWIGKSWAAGCGRSDGVWPLSLLRRELKYSCHSTRRSLSLLGAPSLILTLTLGFRSFPERPWIFFRWWCSQLLSQLVWGLPFVCWALPFHQLYETHWVLNWVSSKISWIV